MQRNKDHAKEPTLHHKSKNKFKLITRGIKDKVLNIKTLLIEKKLKKRILMSLDNGKLDEEAIKNLFLLNQQNRLRLTNDEKKELDKKIVNSALYINGDEKAVFEELIDLIAKGADINAKSSNDWTPLMYASNSGNVKIVEFFLMCGADPNVQASNSYGYNALMLAVIKGYIEIVNLLIKYKANVNAKAKGRWGNWTALMFAAKFGYPDIAKVLLEHGADLNIKNKDGKTALDIAIKFGNKEVIDILRKNSEKRKDLPEL